jgi:hypothetical protein
MSLVDAVPAPAPPGRLLRCLALAAIAIDLALGVVYVLLFAALVATGRTKGADFTAFYTGWRIVLEGRGGQLYDPAVQAAVQQRILGGQTFGAGINPFNNPPHMVLPYLPLGLLPIDASFLVWTAIQAGILVVVATLLVRGVAADWTRTEKVGLVAVLVAFPPLAISFFQGAFALVLFIGVVGAWIAMERDRDGWAGASLGLASIKPQGMFTLGIAAIFWRRPGALISLVACIVALAALSTVVLGPAIWASYVALLGTYTSTFDRLSVDPAVMWNLRGTLALVLGSDSAQLVNGLAYAGFAAAIVITALLWRRGWPRGLDRRDAALRFALTIVIGLLLSPHLNPHDDVIAVLAIALGYGALRGTTIGRALAVGALLAPVAIVAVNGIAADAPTQLPIRLPTVLLVGLAAILAIGSRVRQGGPAGA